MLNIGLEPGAGFLGLHPEIDNRNKIASYVGWDETSFGQDILYIR